MQLVYVLLGVFAVSLAATKYFTQVFDYSLSGRIAMSAMLGVTGIGHFVLTQGMVMMMPDLFPFKLELVYLTGIIEICAAIGLLVFQWRLITARLLILFFILIIPANINAALNHIDLQTGNNTGPGPDYLWFRIPLQVFFIAWVYFFGIRLKGPHRLHR